MTSKRIFAILVIAILLFVAVPALSQEPAPTDQNAEALKQLGKQLAASQAEQQRLRNEVMSLGERNDASAKATQDQLTKAEENTKALQAQLSIMQAAMTKADEARRAAEAQRAESDRTFRRNAWIAGGIFFLFAVTGVIWLARIGARVPEDQTQSLELRHGATDAEVMDFLKRHRLSGTSYIQPLTKEDVPALVEGCVEFDPTRKELVYSFGKHKASAKYRAEAAAKAYKDKSAPYQAIQ